VWHGTTAAQFHWTAYLFCHGHSCPLIVCDIQLDITSVLKYVVFPCVASSPAWLVDGIHVAPFLPTLPPTQQHHAALAILERRFPPHAPRNTPPDAPAWHTPPTTPCPFRSWVDFTAPQRLRTNNFGIPALKLPTPTAAADGAATAPWHPHHPLAHPCWPFPTDSSHLHGWTDGLPPQRRRDHPPPPLYLPAMPAGTTLPPPPHRRFTPQQHLPAPSCLPPHGRGFASRCYPAWVACRTTTACRPPPGLGRWCFLGGLLTATILRVVFIPFRMCAITTTTTTTTYQWWLDV